jgi:hypothetical protein
MNTGIQDSINLAWKLALALRGIGGEALLDSYHEERHPVGQNLLRTTDRLFQFAASQSRVLLGLRNFAAPRLVPFFLRTPARRARAFRFISQLGIEYSKSPIVSEAGKWRGGPAAGHRAPPLECMRGVRHHLLAFGGPAPALGEWKDLIDVHTLPATTAHYELRRSRRSRALSHPARWVCCLPDIRRRGRRGGRRRGARGFSRADLRAALGCPHAYSRHPDCAHHWMWR